MAGDARKARSRMDQYVSGIVPGLGQIPMREGVSLCSSYSLYKPNVLP